MSNKSVAVMFRILVLLMATSLAVCLLSCGFIDDAEEGFIDDAEEEETPAPPPEGMALIPAGDFQMGSEAGSSDEDERPVHTVYVDAFYMDTHEVTNAEYQRFLLANPVLLEQEEHALHNLWDWDGNNYPLGAGDHPVRSVSWYGASTYALWVGKRLPTEAEWEKAARGGLVGKAYPGGDKISGHFGYAPIEAVVILDGGPRDVLPPRRQIDETAAVGSYAANGYGLYDMAGNVWEWCMDVYDPDFYSKSPSRNPLSTPKGPVQWNRMGLKYKVTNSDTVILRGGGWRNNASWDMRVANRSWASPAARFDSHGFRCARDVTP